ncbi:hypothetical protein H0H92_007469 [Tricholoma furcatifolium]|nr:hypothetical protein H0H92_007469 [Tricholoma furcatifolium]
MSFSLAPELIDAILSHLSDTPTIAECALVCRSWVPSARYHLLPSPQVLRLYPIRIRKFLRLIDSPVSTLSFLFFSELRISVDQGWKLSQGEPEKTCTDAGDFLARNLPLPPIKSLFLSYIDWKRLPPSALSSLHTSYRSVKELEVRFIASITFPEFCGFITALESLEKLTFHSGVPFDWDSPTWPGFVVTSLVKITHPNLCKLVFVDSTHPELKQCLSRGISYASGIDSLSFHENIPLNHNNPQFQACGELLETAGTSLRSFKFNLFTYLMGPYHDTPHGSFADFIMLPRNTNVEVIKFVGHPLNETTVKLLLRGLRLSPKPYLHRLQFRLKDGEDGWEKWDWTLLDESFSMISKSLKSEDPNLIIYLPRSPLGWMKTDRDEVRTLEKVYLQEMTEKFKNNLLPRTVQRWKIKLILCLWPFLGFISDEYYLASDKL